MNITLESNKRYTTVEVCGIILEVLEDIIPDLLSNKRKFSPSDLYWMITNLLRYINRMMDGEFKLRSVKTDNWEVVYTDEKAARRKAKAQSKKQMEKAASYIKKVTGNRPKWG